MPQFHFLVCAVFALAIPGFNGAKHLDDTNEDAPKPSTTKGFLSKDSVLDAATDKSPTEVFDPNRASVAFHSFNVCASDFSIESIFQFWRDNMKEVPPMISTSLGRKWSNKNGAGVLIDIADTDSVLVHLIGTSLDIHFDNPGVSDDKGAFTEHLDYWSPNGNFKLADPDNRNYTHELNLMHIYGFTRIHPAYVNSEYQGKIFDLIGRSSMSSSGKGDIFDLFFGRWKGETNKELTVPRTFTIANKPNNSRSGIELTEESSWFKIIGEFNRSTSIFTTSDGLKEVKLRLRFYDSSKFKSTGVYKFYVESSSDHDQNFAGYTLTVPAEGYNKNHERPIENAVLHRRRKIEKEVSQYSETVTTKSLETYLNEDEDVQMTIETVITMKPQSAIRAVGILVHYSHLKEPKRMSRAFARGRDVYRQVQQQFGKDVPYFCSVASEEGVVVSDWKPISVDLVNKIISESDSAKDVSRLILEHCSSRAKK